MRNGRRLGTALGQACHCALHRRQRVGTVLAQVAVLLAQEILEEAQQQFLRLVHCGMRVWTDQDHLLTGDTRTLVHKGIAAFRWYMFQRVKRGDDVEALVLERQLATVTDDHIRNVTRFHIHQSDRMLREELAQHAGTSTYIQQGALAPVLLHRPDEISHQAIALVLVERQGQNGVVHASLSARSTSVPRLRSTLQCEGKKSIPCCMRSASTTSKVTACSR